MGDSYIVFLKKEHIGDWDENFTPKTEAGVEIRTPNY